MTESVSIPIFLPPIVLQASVPALYLCTTTEENDWFAATEPIQTGIVYVFNYGDRIVRRGGRRLREQDGRNRALIGRIASRDESALAALYDCFANRIYTLALHICRDAMLHKKSYKMFFYRYGGMPVNTMRNVAA